MCNERHLYIEKTIDRYYTKLGIKRSLSGSVYLMEALKLSVEDNTLIHRGVTTKLYPMIAQKYNVSPLQVERAIRNLINICYNNNIIYQTMEALSKTELLNVNKYYKPSNSELISLCSWKLKLKLQEEGFLQEDDE